MLTAASFRRFKALEHVDLRLGRSTCIVGANASGKTSVLEGLDCLTRLAAPQRKNDPGRGRVERIFSGRFAPHRLLTAGATQPIELSLDGGWHLQVNLSVVGHDPQKSSAFVLEFVDPHGTSRLASNDPSEASRFHLHLQTAGLAPAARLRLDPTRLVAPSYSDDDVPQMGHDGAGLPSVLAYLLGTRDPALTAIETDLERIIPGSGRLSTRPARIKRSETEFIRINNEMIPRSTEHELSGQRLELVGSRGRGIPADLLSEGTLLVIGLLTVLHTAPGVRLLLLDDIDRGLHPKAQRAVVELLLKVQHDRPELQIVCTTHSPFVLDLFDPADVRVMRRDAQGLAHCQDLTAHPRWPKWQSTLKAGEFWSFVGEDWV